MNTWGQGAVNNVVGWGQAPKNIFGWGSICTISWSPNTNLRGQ
jgi:hypothetical protein